MPETGERDKESLLVVSNLVRSQKAEVAESSKLKAERETKVYVCDIPQKLTKLYKQDILKGL
jgi:hypothetical protein